MLFPCRLFDNTDPVGWTRQNSGDCRFNGIGILFTDVPAWPLADVMSLCQQVTRLIHAPALPPVASLYAHYILVGWLDWQCDMSAMQELETQSKMHKKKKLHNIVDNDNNTQENLKNYLVVLHFHPPVTFKWGQGH